MIVALDAQLTLGTATGIGEYAAGLANALRDQGTTIVELREPRLDPWRFDRRVLWDQVLLPFRARASGAHLLHCVSGTMPAFSALPMVVTVHDVAWLKVQRHTPAYARYYFGAFALKRYGEARAIVVDADFSRRELLAVLRVPPERVHVVYPGVAPEFTNLHREPPGDVILVPGTVERRKNFEVLIRALPLIAPRVRIISVGPFTPYRDECLQLAQSLGVRDRIEFHGYVSRAALVDLYAKCALVAVPSRYEGFGYAAAQALCGGVPVLVSDQSSLPEIADGDAAIVPVDDPKEWARAIDAIVSDPSAAQLHSGSVRARSIERFSWARSAAQMEAIYKTI
ncbi:MAG TPA: glycosyltransferase family 1 protein [Candidatus Rubrimentiphilum sp.]|nr:glycosyltransferase family 1 protein [Candidatus Rubrimentiphilum sp.]